MNEQWLEAGAVVASAAVVGTALGRYFGPEAEQDKAMLLGGATGFVVGLWINWLRGCEVCRQQGATS